MRLGDHQQWNQLVKEGAQHKDIIEEWLREEEWDFVRSCRWSGGLLRKVVGIREEDCYAGIGDCFHKEFIRKYYIKKR